ncbi:hypothetical protein [uncultured Dokdonia sp.]|uniref:hypothetical protein n=1 Tax=uncultured Dokdonia sp. TaxID=575653 RepID=UPI002605033D|nr:hypothetical protein [uncultured Dokdonia sp.]
MKNIKQYLHRINPRIVCIACTLLFIGCSATKQFQLTKENTNAIALGAIVKKEGTLKNNIEVKGMPLLDQKLRVNILEKEFTKASFTQYSAVFNPKKPKFSYNDTIAKKPIYLEVELIDDIGYAQAINEDSTTREYIRNSKKAGVISKIAVVPEKVIDMTKMTTAFLEPIGNQTYALTLYNEKELLTTIPFSEMVVFDYQTSFFCYGKNQRNQVVVMDITEEGKACKRPLERKAQKLLKIKKLVDY